MNNEYLELIERAQKQRIRLNKDQIKHTRELYKDVAKDLERSAKRANKDSLNERWLLDYQKQFKADIKELNKILRKDIESSMLKSAEYATNIQTDFFDLMDIKYKLDAKEHFSTMFSKIPQQSLEELINGEFYKDGKGLSERLWFHGKKTNAEFDYIIQKGIIEKKSTYDLANDLAAYVNPEVRKSWDFKNIYPGIGNKKIEYNSMRLAITSISHAYQLSLQRSCKANPFVEGIEWHTSNSHRGPCELCVSREGKIYTPDELPLDHPLGVCYFIPVVTRSMDEVGTELHDWLHGSNNDRLDDWYSEYGREFVGGRNNLKKFNGLAVSKDGKSGIIKEKELNDLKGYKEPLARRHNLNSISKKSVAKDKNTIIMPSVDVHKDIEDIRKGLFKKIDESFEVNGRVYGKHDGRFYPISGEEFTTLNRNEYKILIKLKTEFNNPRVMEFLKNMGSDEETISKLLDILKKGGIE